MVVVLCAAMMFVVTSAEAGHFHDDALPNAPFSKPLSKSSGTHCLLCSSLHSPAISSAVAVLGTTAIHSTAPVPATLTNPTRLEAFGLFVRPAEHGLIFFVGPFSLPNRRIHAQ